MIFYNKIDVQLIKQIYRGPNNSSDHDGLCISIDAFSNNNG